MQNEKIPLHKQIYNDIIGKIKSGELNEGDKLPTEFELMDLYKVSRITVNRAMTDLVENGFITRVRKKGSFVQKNSTFFETEEKRPVIACLVNVNIASLGDLISGMQQAAQSHKFIINTFCSDRNSDKEHDILKSFLDNKIDGVMCSLIETYKNINLLLKLKMQNIPIVMLDHPVSSIEAPLVCSDNFSAGYEITKYLIDNGHKKIAFLAYSLASSYGEQKRINGYLKAMKDHNLECDGDYILALNTNTSHNMMTDADLANEELAFDFFNKLKSLPEVPTAVVCVHDMMAAYIEEQAIKNGISVPKDLSIVGFDDLYFCNFLKVPLTTMAQDFFSIGYNAVEQMALLKKGEYTKESIFVPCRRIERDSVENKKK